MTKKETGPTTTSHVIVERGSAELAHSGTRVLAHGRAHHPPASTPQPPEGELQRFMNAVAPEIASRDWKALTLRFMRSALFGAMFVGAAEATVGRRAALAAFELMVGAPQTGVLNQRAFKTLAGSIRDHLKKPGGRAASVGLLTAGAVNLLGVVPIAVGLGVAYGTLRMLRHEHPRRGEARPDAPQPSYE